ncbi:MAG TPA: hypothetical protein VK641_10560 [Terriglobales bacterium]|nr:hypothetical protein [Terriglobales bacterium]
MDSARWQRIQNVFHDAADRPRNEQLAFVKAACGDDQESLSEVIAMLEQDGGGHSLLDRSISDVARQMFGEAAPLLPFKEFGPYRILKLLARAGWVSSILPNAKTLAPWWQ